MKYKQSMKIVQWVRIVGWLEALSFLYLLGVAMPMKYIGGNPHAVEIPGSIHGGLFILYMFLLGFLWLLKKPHMKLLAKCFIGAFIPLGPLLYEPDLKLLSKN